ncbi:MAG TPA: hemolysin family protein [Ktedonobacterales bacterium]|nr:hemolysin family protein [Ktedonobacterales bacterium]
MNAFLSFEAIIIFILILANGFFAASEIAIVSARRSRLQHQADVGRRTARQALDLAEHPDRFLATVQIGMTLIGTFASAFGGAEIAQALAAWLQGFPALAPYAQTLGLVIVVVIITYLTLVIGELVPKRLALRHAERIAMFAAPIMQAIARIGRPFVVLLSASVNVVLSLLGQGRAAQQTVTEEDVIYLAREAATSGDVEPAEAQLITRVFQFTDRVVRGVMTPRSEIVAVDVDLPFEQALRVFNSSGYSRLPIYQETLDAVVGILFAKDMLRATTLEQPPNLRDLAHPAIFVPEHQHIDDLMAVFRREGEHLALVVDEYGQITGLLTLEDVLEELVGEIEDEYDIPEEPSIVRREDGSWLVDGKEAYERVREKVGLPAVPPEERGLYTSLAGLVLARLGHIPTVGETARIGDSIFEVVDMDGRRIDRILIRPAPETTPAANHDEK